MDTNNPNNSQIPVQPQSSQPMSQTPMSKFQADPVQTTLNTGRKALSFVAMISSFIALFKRFTSKK